MQLHVREHSRHITIVTIDNQPRRNAMSRQMLGDLAALWDRLDTSDCRCVIVTGAGPKAFTSGADVSGDLSASEETARVVNRALLKTTTFSKPVIAAINGDCIGGGIELMLSCDIRASAPDARFGLTEVKWGIYPFGGATVKLMHQVGYVHAMDLLLTARLIDAQEAARIGLVNCVLPADEVMPWAIATAETIASNSPSAVQAVKYQISSSIADYTQSREALEQELGDKVRNSPHFQEGVSAFREKRRPNYS